MLLSKRVAKQVNLMNGQTLEKKWIRLTTLGLFLIVLKRINNIGNQSYESSFSLKSILSQYPQANVKMQMDLFNTPVLLMMNYGI